MPWKDQKSNMNCFYKTFLILLRSRPINRQTEKNMPTLLSICRLINRQLFSYMLISIELWKTAACGKGPTILCCVVHGSVAFFIK